MNDNQAIKADAGKPRLTLVPHEIMYAIARVREFGVAKYGDPDCWRDVGIDRFRDALMRHVFAYIRDPNGVDEESGLPHLEHVACNAAFLLDLEKQKRQKEPHTETTFPKILPCVCGDYPTVTNKPLLLSHMNALVIRCSNCGANDICVYPRDNAKERHRIIVKLIDGWNNRVGGKR